MAGGRRPEGEASRGRCCLPGCNSAAPPLPLPPGMPSSGAPQRAEPRAARCAQHVPMPGQQTGCSHPSESRAALMVPGLGEAYIFHHIIEGSQSPTGAGQAGLGEAVWGAEGCAGREESAGGLGSCRTAAELEGTGLLAGTRGVPPSNLADQQCGLPDSTSAPRNKDRILDCLRSLGATVLTAVHSV